MSDGLRVIMADFDAERSTRFCASMVEGGCQVIVVDNGADFLDRCREEPPRVAVVEAFLPRKNGFEVLKSLKEDAGTAAVKVVLLLDEDDTYGQHRGRLCGADVILQRPFAPETLLATVRSAAQEKTLEETPAPEPEEGGPDPEIRGVLDALEGRARAENPLIEHITDSLTGLFNSSYTNLKLADEVKKVRRFYHPLTCVLVGIDDQPNIDEPQAAEDLRRIINETAGILLCESRDIDHMARYRGREFVCILPHTDTPGAVAMAERILAAVSTRSFAIKGVANPVTASAGAATFTGTGMDAAEDLIHRARSALLASRAWGGNRTTVWTPDLAPTQP